MVFLIQQLYDQEILVIGEIEYVVCFMDVILIVIIGSNGKMIIVYFIYYLLEVVGKEVVLVGNVGFSFVCYLVQEDELDFFVIEVSSFQLDSIVYFCLQLVVLFNIILDYLDCYNYEMDGYIDFKMWIIRNQFEIDWFWFLEGDENIVKGMCCNVV